MEDNGSLWAPSDAYRRSTPMAAFVEQCNGRFGLSMKSFNDLHAWSVHDRAGFWSAVWDYRSSDEARQDVFDDIEMFYNPKRKHVRNGMLSPVEFEKQQKI